MYFFCVKLQQINLLFKSISFEIFGIINFFFQARKAELEATRKPGLTTAVSLTYTCVYTVSK